MQFTNNVLDTSIGQRENSFIGENTRVEEFIQYNFLNSQVINVNNLDFETYFNSILLKILIFENTKTKLCFIKSLFR